jgi:hypothetical protein
VAHCISTSPREGYPGVFAIDLTDAKLGSKRVRNIWPSATRYSKLPFQQG